MAENVVDERCYRDNERPIAILSIDGGGVRGIIPGKILEFVEQQLHSLHGPDAKIYEYFDMICGTSTGGLIAAMLATPKPNSDEPIIDAKDICQFYIDEAPKIFSNKRWKDNEDEDEEDDESVDPCLHGFIPNILCNKPIYDGEYLRKLIGEKVGERKVAETLTNVLITSFDIKLMKPCIFSTIRAKDDETENVLMSDVGISTSAAPVFFPPHYFENTVEGKKYEFNLADGGLAANNPTLLGIGEMATKVTNQEDKFLVLSLGTGEIEDEDLTVGGRKWGLLDWLIKLGKKIWYHPTYPLIDAFSNASNRMVDIYTSMYLQDKISTDNFLRVQYMNFPSEQAALDNAKPKNLEKLVKLGEDLLNQDIVSVDLPIGIYIKTEKTYRDALIEFVKRLSKIPRPSLEKM